MAGRNIGVAVDFSPCSKAALRWEFSNLTRDGDQLILIHVNNSYQNEQGAMHLWDQIPLVDFSDPHVTKTYGVSPDKETLEILAQVAKQRGVEVCAKLFYGDPAKKVCQSVDLVPPQLPGYRKQRSEHAEEGADGEREQLCCEPKDSKYACNIA